MGKPKLLILTTEYYHPHRFRLHNFIPYFREAFSVRVVDVASPSLDWNFNGSVLNSLRPNIQARLPWNLLDSKRMDESEILTLKSLVPGAIAKLLSYPLVRYVMNKIENSNLILATPYTACMMALFSKTETPIVYEDVDRFYLVYRNPVKRFLVRYLEEYCISHATCVISASPELHNDSKRIRGGNTFFIPNGVDLNFFRNRSESRLKDRQNRYMLVYVGSLESWSGIDIVIEALAAATRKEPRLKFIIIGEGSKDYVNHLKRLAKKLGIQSSINFLGKKSYAEIPRLLSQAGIGVATFHVNERIKRASPLKILDYGAAGLPILMSNVTYFSELVKENEAGIVVENLNAKNIAAGIIGLIRDKSEWQRMALNAMSLMRRYDVKKLAAEEIKILLRLVK